MFLQKFTLCIERELLPSPLGFERISRIIAKKIRGQINSFWRRCSQRRKHEGMRNDQLQFTLNIDQLKEDGINSDTTVDMYFEEKSKTISTEPEK